MPGAKCHHCGTEDECRHHIFNEKLISGQASLSCTRRTWLAQSDQNHRDRQQNKNHLLFTALAITRTGLTGCSKTSPDLDWLNPLNFTSRGKRPTPANCELPPSARSPFRPAAVDTRTSFTEHPLTLIAELNTQLVGMHMPWQMQRTGNSALKDELPALTWLSSVQPVPAIGHNGRLAQGGEEAVCEVLIQFH